jgi:hypothetical protein
LENWNFGKAGAQSLNQQSGAEAALFQEYGLPRRFKKSGWPARQKPILQVVCVFTYMI